MSNNLSIFQINESQTYEPIGIVIVHKEISNERFFELLDIYKSDNPNYNVYGFVEFLQETHNLEAEKVNPTEVVL